MIFFSRYSQDLFIVTQIKLKNKTEEERNVTFRVSGIVAYYTGKPSERIFSKSFTDKLEPNEGIFSYCYSFHTFILIFLVQVAKLLLTLMFPL